MNFVNVRKGGELAITVVFAILLGVPLIAFALGGSRANDDFIVGVEHRTVATMPPQSALMSHTGEYTRGLEHRLADVFPLRTPLIEGYDWAKFTLFGDSTSAEVLRGSNGWLFLGQPNARAYIEGTKRPSDIDLDYFVQVFAARAEFCRAHGARYLLAFPPDKSSVYPEFLPANVTLARPTPLERLIPRLRAAHIEVVDLMPALLEAKRDGEVYSRGDTHWNGRGAYAAYRVIAAALRSSGVKPIDPTSVREQLGVREGDLLGMSGVGRLFADRQVDVTFVQRSRRIETPQYADTEPAGHGTEPFATVRDDPSLPTAVMFSDSFAFRLWPFLDESFRRLLHVRTSTQPFNEHLIVAERPVVVIQELVERTLTEPQEQ